jgi:DNA-directed RNA polymerase subunit RPC12/RpoP
LKHVTFIARRGNMEGYCLKCRAKVQIKSPKAVTLKNGRPAMQGVCPKCGTKVFRIGKA